jgi:hypothetical protein
VGDLEFKPHYFWKKKKKTTKKKSIHLKIFKTGML